MLSFSNAPACDNHVNMIVWTYSGQEILLTHEDKRFFILYLTYFFIWNFSFLECFYIFSHHVCIPVCAPGLLPFGSIFIEMYFMFTAFWSYKFYYVYGFMLLVYLILVMVTVCTTIVAVYFILNAENPHWLWMAMTSAGSTAAYVFLYSIFYFFFKTQMTGFLQVCFYFGYM